MTLTSGSNIQVANVITYQKLLTPAPLGLSCSSSERCWTLFSKSLSLCSNSAETRVFAWTLNTSPDSLQNETVNLRDPTHPFFFFFFFLLLSQPSQIIHCLNKLPSNVINGSGLGISLIMNSLFQDGRPSTGLTLLTLAGPLVLPLHGSVLDPGCH